MSKCLDKNGVQYLWNKMKSYVASHLSSGGTSEWKEAAWVAGYAKTFDIDVTDWKECLLVCSYNGLDAENRRVLTSSVIPKSLFAIGYGEIADGRHQAYYNATYRVGLDFNSNTKIRLYASSNSLCRVYYR